ncbi:MAG: sigma-70 family RNA polymerase sigma factor [Acidimicrobiales bacterium]
MTDQQPNVGFVAGETFADFYRREHDGQVRRAYLIVGDSATAHDVVANAFVAVYQRWNRIEEHGPYLGRCVLNGCRDAGRRHGRERVVAHLGLDGNEAQSAADTVAELSDVLGALPFRQRAAIVLRFYGGCSEAEIADHLDCRPGTVGSLIHRGLRTLRNQLAPQE